MSSLTRRVLTFWFQGESAVQEGGKVPPQLLKRWFMSNADFDNEINSQFGKDIEDLLQQKDVKNATTAEDTLAIVLLLDQFTRNIYRKSAKAFAGDGKAQQLALNAVETGQDTQLSPLGRAFLYMPFEHAESLKMQELSVEKFGQLKDEHSAESPYHQIMESFLKYAQDHKSVIERFGRFPYRNEVLCRQSTPAELEYLNNPNTSRYGQ